MRHFGHILALSAGLALIASQAAGADHAEGERIYNIKCSYCHSLSSRTEAARPDSDPDLDVLRRAERRRPLLPEGPPRATAGQTWRRGPHFEALFQRPPGAVRGFPYRVIYRIDGPVWTAADLDAWIAFHASIEPDERADLIAYLKRATRAR